VKELLTLPEADGVGGVKKV